MKVIRISLKHIHHIVFSPIFSAEKFAKFKHTLKSFQKQKKKQGSNSKQEFSSFPFASTPNPKTQQEV
jgi:hypothetical protein